MQKSKAWVRFKGEEEEYTFPMKKARYGKGWAFVEPREAAADEAAADEAAADEAADRAACNLQGLAATQ